MKSMAAIRGSTWILSKVGIELDCESIAILSGEAVHTSVPTQGITLPSTTEAKEGNCPFMLFFCSKDVRREDCEVA